MEKRIRKLIRKLNFQAVIKSAASAASPRSEIGESGSEKELCTLLRSNPQNDPTNISHAPKRPETAYSSRSGDPRENQKKIRISQASFGNNLELATAAD